jgi:hypothetical protein
LKGNVFWGVVLTMFDAQYCYCGLNQMGIESFYICAPNNSHATRSLPNATRFPKERVFFMFYGISSTCVIKNHLFGIVGLFAVLPQFRILDCEN